MISIPETVREFFIAAGWHKGRRSLCFDKYQNCDSANMILKEFGGLDVGSCGNGLEGATSNIRFYNRCQDQKSIVVEPWRQTLGKLHAIADAHNDHMIVFIDQFEQVFLFTDSDEQLYPAGRSFAEAMEILLLGKHVSRSIPRDSE